MLIEPICTHNNDVNKKPYQNELENHKKSIFYKRSILFSLCFITQACLTEDVTVIRLRTMFTFEHFYLNHQNFACVKWSLFILMETLDVTSLLCYLVVAINHSIINQLLTSDQSSYKKETTFRCFIEAILSLKLEAFAVFNNFAN